MDGNGSAALTAGRRATDEAKRLALRRTKAVATAALALCIAVFLAARHYESRWPLLSFVAAFAEAAAIGGIADWYAVVALFRRPLGLPIPHTAIIPRNQDRIADNLGRFIETNFLAPGPVRRKLEEVDFAAMVADWLASSRRSKGLAEFVGRLLPHSLAAIDGSGLKSFVTGRVLERLERVDVAPFAADMLAALTADRRHQQILDEMLGVLGRYLCDEEALAALRDRIRDELPTLAKFFRGDVYLLRKIVRSAGVLIDEVQADPEHAVRREFDEFVAGFVQKLRESPDYAERAERLKRDLLARPELRGLAEDIWAGMRAFIEQDVAVENSTIRAQLADMFVEAGRQLANSPDIRGDMNHGFVVALASFVESQKSGVSEFIAGQVRGWDLGQLTRLIELNIGRDLQYIRFNGMVIGGLAGLLLHIAERLLFGA